MAHVFEGVMSQMKDFGCTRVVG